jgi:hypothetical protein
VLFYGCSPEIESLDQLLTRSREDLSLLRGLGKGSLDEIEGALEEFGLALRDESALPSSVLSLQEELLSEILQETRRTRKLLEEFLKKQRSYDRY